MLIPYSLTSFCFQQFKDDKVLIPKETAWFGYYPDGAFSPVLPPQRVSDNAFLYHMRDSVFNTILDLLNKTSCLVVKYKEGLSYPFMLILCGRQSFILKTGSALKP